VRVLFLSQIVPYPPHGGVLQRGYHIVRELGREARVHLLAFIHPDVLPTPAAVEDSRAALRGFCEAVEYFPLWPKRSPVHKLTALTAAAFSSTPFSVIAHRSAAFRQRVAALLETGGFDLVHVDTIALSPFVEGMRRPPAVLTHHNIESMLMARRSEVERGGAARRYLAREAAKLAAYEAETAPRYELNVFMSAHDADTFTGRVPHLRTAVVPNGVDTEYFTPAPDRETPALVYTGGMNMFANRDAVMYFLEQVWPQVTARVPEVRFFAVGQDPPPELKAIAAADPRVVVTGYVDDIRPYVAQAAVYVVPLRVGGGTRLKVLDAMASGKAMVSTSIGCEGLEVAPGRHLLTADTPAAFAEATVTLLNDAPRRRELGAAARALVEERYAWRHIGRSLREAYAQAMSAGGVK
jgi:sugar transferase (PEP-CTERM/EpsH1 system associated)